jgi:imidazole glycerol-phosphate synthase subunit HisF
VIPCLLVKNGGLVKTVQFSDPKYVGDPINAVRIFNEKEVDELVVLDIDATSRSREPDYVMIGNLAMECRMPLCYGGGVSSVAQAERIIAMGVEKVAMSAAALADPGLVSRMSTAIGSQSVVVVLDVRKSGANKRYEVWTHNGTRCCARDVCEIAAEMESRGVGEIIVNSIDNDGAVKGYDMALVDAVRKVVTVPLTALGGAGSMRDIAALIERFGIIGAAAGSMFVFKGVYRAVLISYPSRAEKDALVKAP